MNEPWYRSPTLPLLLRRKFSSNFSNRFRSLALFPWNSRSSLWHDLGDIPIDSESWNAMINEYTGLLAAASDRCVLLISSTRKSETPIKIEIPEQTTRVTPTDKTCVAWALSPEKPYNPLLLISFTKLLYIYDVRSKQICGCLRGHGGNITSINVHPIHPHIFCTTSRDFSTRIYRLSERPKEHPANLPWPADRRLNTRTNLAGPAHGLDMSGEEGWGMGRCVVVLVGGLSGGHNAEVLGAAFHIHLPLLATCGMDRAVKIWNVPSSQNGRLVREDKPLFSTTLIHKARVLSVTWLSDDTLLTHGAPAIMRSDYTDTSTVSESSFGEPTTRSDPLEPGTVVLWRWLGLDRFFPPGWELQTRFVGCASDYQDSSSFRIIASYFLPAQETQYDTVHMNVTLDTLDPLILYLTPASTTINIKNVTHFEPRPLPDPELRPSSSENLRQVLAKMNRRMRLLDDPNDPQGWKIVLENKYRASSVEGGENDEVIESCIACMGGSVVIAGGSRGSIWIWS
ncbi:WD40 repeat-like protein [Dendrothele bispora CBS 962.96]|uniref:WD40 repeat-like protein n=1 Tax=Dendrothele bispora (strain CBS 962.96) TaxID=1314807 RepID=A0A4S8MWJ6_DENBC|nr:WD40 repeat-like protein [Dendrothele bispora CBS 962.96]